MEELLIILLFGGALVYLGFILRRSFHSEKGCAKNCGCDASPARSSTKH